MSPYIAYCGRSGTLGKGREESPKDNEGLYSLCSSL